MGQYITHQGRVESINEKHIKVRITQTSACASCEAKKLCNSSESKEKLIDIYTDKANNYKIGDVVEVMGTLKMAYSAVQWAFAYPLIIIILTIIGVYSYNGKELVAAIIALGALTLYYTALFFLRDKMGKKFSFTIKHINK